MRLDDHRDAAELRRHSPPRSLRAAQPNDERAVFFIARAGNKHPPASRRQP
jgi:hypothetical protein